MDPKHKTRRQFSKQFKAETISLIQSSGKSVPQVCRDLDLAETLAGVDLRLSQPAAHDTPMG